MTSRDRVINTLCHQTYTPAPILLSIPKELERKRTEFCAQLRSRFQSDIEMTFFNVPDFGNRENTTSALDEWGCVWNLDGNGAWNPSPEPRYADILELEGIRFPKNPVTSEMLETVSQWCDNSSHFTLVQTRIHPFRRLCALGGVEVAKSLIQRKPRELREIAMRLYEYYARQLDCWCDTTVDAIGLEDDLADENGMRMSTSRWNEIFVPMLCNFCSKIRARDKFVYFTGTGNFEKFIPGLIYAGVDAIRYDATLMDAGMLAERYGRRVAFQPIVKSEMIEQETEETLSEKILALRTAFGETDLIAECQVSPKAEMRKVAATMLNWRRRMPQPEEF